MPKGMNYKAAHADLVRENNRLAKDNRRLVRECGSKDAVIEGQAATIRGMGEELKERDRAIKLLVAQKGRGPGEHRVPEKAPELRSWDEQGQGP